MPAQSPTLSPTLSAMVAGLRGSSSGMPASTLPTRSPPTSAPLGEDAAAETGEDGDQRRAEAERHKRIDDVAAAAFEAHDIGQDPVIDSNAEQRQACHEHAGDGTGLEGDVEAGGKALRRGLRGAHIGADRDMHADEAGRAREDRADQEAESSLSGKKEKGKNENSDADNADRPVLARQIGLGTFSNISRNFLHSGIALVGGQHRLGRPDRIGHG
jgi:hypothetical protein